MKSCEHLYRALYFGTSAYWGWSILHKYNFLYAGIGGPKDGDLLNFGLNTVFDSYEPALLDYSLYTYGFHFGNLIQHGFEDWNSSDFYEMLVHHIAANSLYFGYIFGNCINFGSVIAYLHDLADVPANLSKTLSSTKFTTPPLLSGILMIVTWGYTRIYILP